MHPHSYTLDSLSKSQDLASSILSSSTPSQISSVCTSIDSFLHSHTPDQSRHFFSLTFPTLICKLYGFYDTPPPPSSSNGPHHHLSASSNGWIDIIYQSNDSDLASKVFNLLSPNGVVFRSISAVDRQSLVKYVFPVERLPEWAKLMLSGEKDGCHVLNNLCPFFRGKIKEQLNTINNSNNNNNNHSNGKGGGCGSLYYQVQLNVFEYFMYWFAYYPIMKGNCENFSNNNKDNGFRPQSRIKKLNLENLTKSITGFSISKRGNDHKLDCNLYLRLLYAYLQAFVPITGLEFQQPYGSSFLNYGCVINDDGFGSNLSRAEFFVDTLVNYWLVDNDFSPLPVGVCKSLGLSFPFRSVLGETPPTLSLGEVVKLLVKYLNLSANVVKEGGTDCVESAHWNRISLSSFDVKSREFSALVNDSPIHVVGLWNSWIQRPVYRFILRTFLFCPVGASIKNASQVFLVWVSYLEPWKSGFDDFVELDAIVGGLGKDVKKEYVSSNEHGYSSLWQDYILSNYLYYSSLVMHFVGFAHKFLHTDPEVIVQMLLQVMKILTSSKELTDLIKNVDAVFHSKAGSGKSMLSSSYRHVSLIREQLQDWEDGLCESDADGSFLHENWNRDLRLFSDGEDGGQQLLQLFILRAEVELQAIYGDNLAHNLQLIDSLKEQVSYLFGGVGSTTVKQLSFTPATKQFEQSREEIFKPRRAGNHPWANVKYKGDWMKRPISDDEVAWLAKLLVWLSGWLNESLGLNQMQSSDARLGHKWSYVEVSSDMENVCGSTETMKMVVCAMGSWFLALCAATAKLMRKHGLRVNLRMLASKKIVMVLLMYALFSIGKKVYSVS